MVCARADRDKDLAPAHAPPSCFGQLPVCGSVFENQSARICLRDARFSATASDQMRLCGQDEQTLIFLSLNIHGATVSSGITRTRTMRTRLPVLPIPGLALAMSANSTAESCALTMSMSGADDCWHADCFRRLADHILKINNTN